MNVLPDIDSYDLFEWAALLGHGPFSWKKEAITEKTSGVYIRRAKKLNRRLGQFIRHISGRHGPHKGGATIIPLEKLATELLV